MTPARDRSLVLGTLGAFVCVQMPMMKMTHSTKLLASALFVFGAIAGCSADPADSIGDTNSRKLTDDAPGKSTVAGEGTTAPKPKLPPLPNQTPVRTQSPVTTARQVLTAGPFTGQQPEMRANDRHEGFEVTGKDCMTCHGTGGTAPHFALGGTIALGKSWVWGTPAWSTAENSGNAYGSYDGYGSYDTNNGGSYGDLGDGYQTGGGGGGGYGDDGDYGDYGGAGCDGYGGGGGDGYDTGGYGGGGGGGGGYGDDDGYDTGGYGDDGGGYGECRGGGKGWPTDRTTPSAYTGVRIVSSDGYIFDCVTDTDGNFWFKSPEDVKVPAYTGIRYGTFTVTGDTNGIACASCHESGKPDSPGRLWTWDGPTPRR